MILFLLFAGMGIVAVLFYFLYTKLRGNLRLAFVDKFGKKPIENLSGKVVWIVGASSGIGEGLAYAFAKCGCKLIISARRKEELERVKKRCVETGNIAENCIIVLPMDVLELQTHLENFQKILNQLGKLDILIYNAGHLKKAKWHLATAEQDKEVFELNVFAPVNLVRRVVPYFAERKSGHVVAISSISAYTGFPSAASYAASKLALGGFLETLRLEQHGNNIDVTLIYPGAVMTDALLDIVPPEALNHPMYQSMMTVEQCARLIAVAVANRLPFAWICKNPVLTFAYINYYFPELGFMIYKLQAKYNPIPTLQ